MKKLNNRGFAISTVIYGTFILFIMLLAILLASMNSSLRLLEDRVNTVNNYDVSVEKQFEQPDLSTGLIPVIYDSNGSDTNWFVADVSSDWYNYDEQRWANAISVKIDSKNKYITNGGAYNVGEEIDSSDWLAMFVWIPRFSYTIGCKDGNCLGYKTNKASGLSYETPGAIDIKFIKKNHVDEYNDIPKYEITSQKRNPINYLTHPAFRWDENGNGIIEENEELSGIWIGKFETSSATSSTCYKSVTDNCEIEKTDIRILPKLSSVNRQTIGNQFKFSQYISNTSLYGISGDSHMTKNSEWSAMTYLSQSIYGKYGNDEFENGNKKIYKNDSYLGYQYTGCSFGTLSNETTDENNVCSYEYNGKKSDGTICEECGIGASTTGTIYGIYDTAGGLEERVMSFYNNDLIDKGFSEEWINDSINIKYYDNFKSSEIYSSLDRSSIGQSFGEVFCWWENENCSNVDSVKFSDSNSCLTRGSISKESGKTPFYLSVNDCEISSSSRNDEWVGFRITLVKPN